MYAATMYPAEQLHAILRAWRELVETAPDEVTSDATPWSVPPDPQFPAELHGRQIVLVEAVYSGAVETGEQILQPFRELGEPLLDLSGPVPYVALQSALDELFPKGQVHCYWKSVYLDRLDDEVIDAIDAWRARCPSPRSLLPIRQLGGAISRIGAGETAFHNRSAPYLLSIDSAWEDSRDAGANIEWTRAFWADMQRFSDGAAYLNFDVPEQVQEEDALLQASAGGNYERLVALKNRYDPDNLFRLNHNIKPTVASSLGVPAGGNG